MADLNVKSVMHRCAFCGNMRVLVAKGLCRQCYKSSLKRDCSNCGKFRLMHARGLCSNCYHSLGVNRRVVCASCGFSLPHYARGMCRNCYNRQLIYAHRKKHKKAVV
jgi:predicted RNA-binding Zn-ribbon protein involved in translation (DUF1610 family)